MAEIKVVDQKFKQNTAETFINVVEPFKVQLEFADISDIYGKTKLVNKKNAVSSFGKQLGVEQWTQNWIMVEDKTYLVRVLLFDKDDNQIYLTSNIEFGYLADSTYLDVIESNLI